MQLIRVWPLQDDLLFRGFRARINTHLCKHPLCLNPPFIAHTIAHYIVLPPTPLYCNAYYTILIMAISCKGAKSAYLVLQRRVPLLSQ